jgi:hypothetical protein
MEIQIRGRGRNRKDAARNPNTGHDTYSPLLWHPVDINRQTVSVFDKRANGSIDFRSIEPFSFRSTVTPKGVPPCSMS